MSKIPLIAKPGRVPVPLVFGLLVMMASPCLCQEESLSSAISALGSRHSKQRVAAVDRLVRAGKKAVPLLVGALAQEPKELAFNDVVGLGGGAGGRFRRRLFPARRPSRIDERVSFIDWNAGLPYSRRFEHIAGVQIREKRDIKKVQDPRVLAAWALGEIGLPSTDFMDRIAPFLKDRDKAVGAQVAHTLAKLGPRSIPVLTPLIDDNRRYMRALTALHRIGGLGQRAIYARLRRQRPSQIEWRDVISLESLRLSKDEGIIKRRGKLCLQLAGAKLWRFRVVAGATLALEDPSKNYLLWDAFAKSTVISRWPILIALLRRHPGLSANLAMTLSDVFIDGDKGYSLRAFHTRRLRTGSPERMTQLGTRLAHCLPGLSEEEWIAHLALLRRLGSYAKPAEAILRASRKHVSPRLRKWIDSSLGSLGDKPMLREERYPDLEAARRTHREALFGKERKDYARWRELVRVGATDKRLRFHLSKKDWRFLHHVRKDLRASYRVPRTEPIALRFSSVPGYSATHAEARRWLDEHRLLPKRPESMHRAFEGRKAPVLAAGEAEKSHTRLQLSLLLAVGEILKRRPADEDVVAFEVDALLDADLAEVRAAARHALEQCAGKDFLDRLLERWNFPIRQQDQLLCVRDALPGALPQVLGVVRRKAGATRLAAMLTIVSWQRQSGVAHLDEFRFEEPLFDWQSEVAALQAEYLREVMSKDELSARATPRAYQARLKEALRRNSDPVAQARFIEALSSPFLSKLGTDWIQLGLLVHPLPRAATLAACVALGGRAKAHEKMLRAYYERMKKLEKRDDGWILAIETALRAIRN